MRGPGIERRPVCEFAPDYDAKVPWVRTFLWQLIVRIIVLLLFILGICRAGNSSDCSLPWRSGSSPSVVRSGISDKPDTDPADADDDDEDSDDEDVDDDSGDSEDVVEAT